MLGLVPGERLGGHPGVLGEAADAGVPGAGEQQRGGHAVLGRVGQGRMPQLVQGRAAGRRFEHNFRAAVPEAGAGCGGAAGA